MTLGVCAAVTAVVPAEQRLIRAVAGVYAVAAVATFLVPSPVGANITRLGAYAAAPVVLAVGFARRRLAAALLAVVAFWQWSPAFDAIVQAGNDPSTEAAYYRPLLEFFAGADAAAGRVEIVPTARHWEAAFVALELPIARGWERQLDMRFNPMFYEPGLDAPDLRNWLVDRGVRYVALPDAPLDSSGRAEARLLTDGIDGLRPAWRDEHWRVWEVVGADGLVDAAQADVVDVSSDSITLDVRRRGDLLVRLHASAFWTAEPLRCVAPTADEWIVVRDAQVGRLVLTLDATDLVTLDDPCDQPPP